MTTIATGSYHGFDVRAQAALQVLSEWEGAELFAEDRVAVMEQMDEPPPFDNAAGTPQRPRGGGRGWLP